MPQHDIPLNTFGSTAGRKHMSGPSPRPKTLTVDLHNHLQTPAAAELVEPHLPENAFTGLRYSNPKTQAIIKDRATNRPAGYVDPDARVADMDRMNLDVMALSCVPGQFYYMTEPTLGHESSQMVNDNIHSKVKAFPTRFVGLGTIPMQDTDLALKELDRCVNELGFRGIQIGARVMEDELSAERLEPIWARCQELDIVIFVHPRAFASTRFSRHYLTNIVGNPLDTTTAMHYLIFDGVMERYPKIKFYMAHGGAFASHYAARMDHAYGAREDCREHIYKLPSTYLKRFYFDTIVFATDQLEFLAKKYGADHLLLGTDYPADMADFDPVEHVYQCEGFSESDREKICGTNALRLLGLDESNFRI